MAKKKVYQPPRRGKVRILHPKAGSAEVLPESVSVWVSRGWKLEDAPEPVEPPAEVPADDTQNTGDDPANKEVR